MLDFALPEISADAHPLFTDSAGCAAWLAELPLVNVAPSQIRMLDQLQELNRFSMPAAERLKVLESLREPICFVQAEQMKKLASKPLPLTTAERGIFAHVVEMWEQSLLGYQRCLQDATGGGIKGETALLCQRAMECVAANMFDHYRAYHKVPGACWTALHRLYEHAEAAGESVTPIEDPVRKIGVSCTEIYVRALLLAMTNPNEQSQRQLSQMQRWLEGWSEQVPVRRSAPADKGLPALMVDFSAPAGAYREPETAARSASRWLDVGELASTLKKRVVMLRKGETPASLGLGEDVSMPGVEQQMVFLFRVWCEGKNGRVQTRRSISSQAQVTSSIASMNFFISGKTFRQPGHATELTKKQRDEIATLGRVSTSGDDEYSQMQGYAEESWLLQDESLSGFSIVRPAATSGGRYTHRQLIAVRPADAKGYMVGTIQWLMTDDSGALHAGVLVIPGLPQAVAVRPTGINAQSEKFIPALYCPEVPALHAPASLILPVGWYKPKRVLEVHSDGSAALLLTGVIQRGGDFERVSIELAK
jgi:hypothetical protein